MRGIAALYVEPRGAYAGLPDVDLWDQARDARQYPGPYPVVAHPPCARWCRLAGLVESRLGLKRGDDGGTFAAALASVRAWGGVLEHPAYSDAWAAHGLNRPPPSGGWVSAGFCGGWTCHVEQGRYGHAARKATWLYAHGVDVASLSWGAAQSGRTHVRGRGAVGSPTAGRSVELQSRAERIRTPIAFRDVLLAIARSAST